MISLQRALFELKLLYKKIKVNKKYPNVVNTIIDKSVMLSETAVINGSILVGNVKLGNNVFLIQLTLPVRLQSAIIPQ